MLNKQEQAMAYTYEYPRPSVTVDGVVLRLDKEGLFILMIQRASDPFKDHWALPGGFLDMDETPEVAVKRELEEETGLKASGFIEIGVFGEPERDPRGRVLSITFLTIFKGSNFAVKAESDAKDAKWINLKDLPDKLAFDHSEIINTSIYKLIKELKLAGSEKKYKIFDFNEDEIKKVLRFLEY